MHLVVVKSKDGSRSYPLVDGRPTFIGRARECDIILPSPAVSRRHAVIMFKNGVCGIKDLGSFNGTLLNDQLIREPCQLAEGDVIRISAFTIELRLTTIADAPPDTPIANVPAPAQAQEIGTVDMSMETILQPPQGKGIGPGPAHFANSTIRLPRAMQLEEYEAAAPSPRPEDAAPPRAARVTTSLRKRGDAIPLDAEDAAPDSPAEAPSVDRDGGETIPIAPTAKDTAFFREPPCLEQPDEDAPEEEEDNGAEEITAETLLTRAEAEAVIPLIEPEAAPTLTLDEDEATNAALEKLIEDLPAFTWERLDGNPVGAPAAPPVDEGELELEEAYLPGGDPAAGDSGDTEYPRDAPGSDTAYIEINAVPPRAEPAGSPAAAGGGSDGVSIPPTFMDAINARLELYSRLADLSDERKLLRASEGGLDPMVAAELDRQDLETGNIPIAEEATRLAATLKAERKNGTGVSTAEKQAAEELALRQWALIRDYNMDALPPVYKEAYRLAVDEPLTRELTRARIAHGRLLGGAAYLLALESLCATAGSESRRLARQPGGREGKGGLLSRFSRLAKGLAGRPDPRGEAAGSRDDGDSGLSRLGEVTGREMKFMIRTLNREFRQVYLDAALYFIPMGERMPVEARAFLRYGAVGFQPWWMSADTRKFILADCAENVLSPAELDPEELTVLYADEYLAAVSEMECPPSPDDRLNALERNSVEVKTDRAYRRIVNARTYNVLMQTMLAGLDERMQRLERERLELEDKIAGASGAGTKRDSLYELQTEHQAVVIRRSNLDKHVKRIETEVVASIIESVQEAEGRFRKGELAMPSAEQLIRREVAAMFEQCRRMEGKRERFLPLVLKQFFPTDGDVVSTRRAIRAEMAELEKSDPGVFTNVVIPAKKKINRMELRVSPIVAILPVSGQNCLCVTGREEMEGGHLAVPICFSKDHLRSEQLIEMLADFRWETARKMCGRDIMNSDTLVGAFMRLRWEWRGHPRSKREKGLIFKEATDAVNWRRIYETYMADAREGGRQLFLRNPDCYNAIIGKYIELPPGVQPPRRAGAGE